VTTISVASYNIQVGISSRHRRDYLTQSWKHILPFPGRQNNLGRIGRFLSRFDLVGLQELDSGSLRSGFVNQSAFLAQRAGMPFWASSTHRDLGRFAQHSMGVVSRFPPLSQDAFRLPGRIPGRGALHVALAIPGGALNVLVLHLALGTRARHRQLHYLAAKVRELDHVVVLGDFNCDVNAMEFIEFRQLTGLLLASGDMPSYPSWRPARGVDHILVGRDLACDTAQVHAVGYSDHLPVSVRLDIRRDHLGTTWPGVRYAAGQS